jgi:uncharacterized phage protein gp47/JayE
MQAGRPALSYSTEVPAIEFDTTGVVLPSESDILSGVQSDMDTAFGGGLNASLTTPQGQLATSQTAIIAEKNSEIAYICNQVDPLYASGRFQDAIGRIYYMDRKAASSTMVTCNLTGITGTIIPSGTQAQDTSGNSYTLMAQVTIGSTGTSQGVFENTVTGPVSCPAGTLTKIYQGIDGWDSVTNPSDGVLGADVETRTAFEYRRKNSVALNSQGTPAAVYAAVFAVDGVTDCYVIDNPLPTIVESGSTNYPLDPHSIYVAATGGTAADIAEAIWDKKAPGCNYNGNTTVTVADSNYSYPQPSYSVKYNIPTPTPILFDIKLVNQTSLPSDIVSLVQTAVIAQFNGTNGATPARIGALIMAPSFYSAIIGVSTSVLIDSVLIGTSSANSMSVQMGIDQEPTISASNIAVTLVSA